MDLTVRSPAKINWTLRIIRRREDGFHELESLVSAVTLYDELAFSEVKGLDFALTCDTRGVPVDERNLIRQAASLLADEAPRAGGVTCRLTKRIPVGGGLGGGSSNAAATLKALNRLWSLDWPTERLHCLAGRLGSDVPFFLYGGSAVIRGRGERVEVVKLGWRGWIVLLLPGFSVPTGRVYGAWEPLEPPGDCAGAGTEEIGSDRLAAVEWMEKAYNMLEAAVMRVAPALGELVDRAAVLAARPVRVSGSGSTLFTAFDTRSEAQRFAELASEELRLSTRVVQLVEQA
jgi:4-diphosphocytidyl-2-C-methyl-D-erythritol kinase